MSSVQGSLFRQANANPSELIRDYKASLMPRHRDIFAVPDVRGIRNRAQLSTFIQSRRETQWLECKTLRDLHTCPRSDCPYCRGRRLPHGVPIAEAITAFANGAGGLLIIGAEEHPNGSGRFRLESSRCQNLTYRADWLSEVVANLVHPPVDHQIREIHATHGSPPSFVVTVQASFSLHGWAEHTQQALRYPVRLAGTVHDMTAPELELRVRTKDSVRANVEFRCEVFDILWHLFDAVLDRPAAKPRQDITLDWVLRTDPYGISKLDPGLSRWPNFREIERAVLEMPAKMAYYSSSRDIELAVMGLSYARDDLTPGALDLSEHRLVSAAKVLARHQGLRERLMPKAILDELLAGQGGNISEGFMNYDEPFEQAYDRIARQTGMRLLDDQVRRSSILGMVDALSLLLPLGFRVLQFYERLCLEYGVAAIGVRPDFFHPRRRRRRV